MREMERHHEGPWIRMSRKTATMLGDCLLGGLPCHTPPPHQGLCTEAPTPSIAFHMHQSAAHSPQAVPTCRGQVHQVNYSTMHAAWCQQACVQHCRLQPPGQWTSRVMVVIHVWWHAWSAPFLQGCSPPQKSLQQSKVHSAPNHTPLQSSRWLLTP